jgi:hypothetical protein
MIHVQKVIALNVAPYKCQTRGPAVAVTILAYTYSLPDFTLNDHAAARQMQCLIQTYKPELASHAGS